jgi:hypothetical protein
VKGVAYYNQPKGPAVPESRAYAVQYSNLMKAVFSLPSLGRERMTLTADSNRSAIDLSAMARYKQSRDKCYHGDSKSAKGM